jgi:SAM-dependent methyltransferase
MPDYSEEFYVHYASRYAEVSHQLLQSIYIESSHPELTSDLDLINHLKTLVPGKRGLDAGCGAGARDVYNLWSEGYDVFGVDVVKENIDTAIRLHPEIKDRLWVNDLKQELPFPDHHFDFVLCNAVIQHIEPEIVRQVVLPELCRLLKKGGVLQLMFKNGSGVLTVFDKDYETERSFQLYDEYEILRLLTNLGMELIASESDDQLGGIMFFTDPKHTRHCVFHVRKVFS